MKEEKEWWHMENKMQCLTDRRFWSKDTCGKNESCKHCIHRKEGITNERTKPESN